MSSLKEALVPDIGDFKDVAVIEVLVKPGDAIRPEQSLVTVESDKATMEIPSPAGGVVKELRVKVGDKVSKGSLILLFDAEESAPAVAPGPAAPSLAAVPPKAQPPQQAAVAEAARPAAAAPRPAPVPYAPAPVPGAAAHASPSVRKFARELGVELAKVKGTGPKGRISQGDVQEFVKGIMRGGAIPAPAVAAAKGGYNLNLPAWPQVEFAKFGAVETRPLSRIRKLSGGFLHRNWVGIPHVTQHDEADITDLEAYRKENAQIAEKQGFKLTMLAFLVKASADALQKFPDFNSSLDPAGENLIVKKYYHIGVAVDTPDGLVVPVIRDADRKGVFDVARELADISKRAREKKLKPDEMRGGTFSISSLGGIGGTAFTPIINAPEVAILGVSRSQTRPVYKDGAFVPRLMLPMSLAYDHRVIDGAAAARFTTHLASVLSDFRGHFT
jgi:pyruvate dehydrogenase E2 component (dihydrolipoamide acetyltransferase)